MPGGSNRRGSRFSLDAGAGAISETRRRLGSGRYIFGTTIAQVKSGWLAGFVTACGPAVLGLATDF